MKKVGLLVGQERSFPESLIKSVVERDVGVVAEWIKLGGTTLKEVSDYDVIVDRASHLAPFYRIFLKFARLQGVIVINDPLARVSVDKFSANYIAKRQGVRIPKSVVLPNKEYAPDVDNVSLTNLAFPIEWANIVEYVGLPAVIKPAIPRTHESVTVIHSVEDLVAAYDKSGLATMMVQEFIQWERYVRCICIGRQRVLSFEQDQSRSVYGRHHEESSRLSSRIASPKILL